MIANCVCCGAFSSLDKYRRCKVCGPVDEYLLLEVRDFLRKSGKVSIARVCEEFGVDETRVQRWIAEDRLGYLSPTYTCTFCGNEVVEGFMCPCQNEARKEFKYFGSPRTVQKRREKYWDEVSQIRKHQRRDIWMIKR